MTDLAGFLLARIAEDEAVAKACAAIEDSDRWTAEVGHISTVEGLFIGGYPSEDYSHMRDEAAIHVARHDPARVLAECEAKRRIVVRYQRCLALVGKHPSAKHVEPALRCILGELAVPYADHPDYREEWKP